MKKATLQDIANSLGISRTTVWKVFSGHEGVSDNMKEKVLTRARELNYKFSEELIPGSDSSVMLNIAVVVCRPESSIFWMSIIHEIAKELSFQNANLIYTYLPSAVDESYELPTSLTGGNVHGIIVLNVYQDFLIQLLANLDVPKVFLDTVTSVHPCELNGDLILMENSNSMNQLTSHLIHQGKKRFGFIGDIQYALSNYERYEGFLRALNHSGITPEPAFMLTSFTDVNADMEEMDAFLDGLSELPEVFVCVSDYVAYMLIQLLQKRNLCVPKDVAVSGFDSTNESPISKELTTVQVFTEDLGRRLALQILFRITYPEARNEIVYISTQPVFRNSTDD